MKHNAKEIKNNLGEAVKIKGNDKKRGAWKIGIIQEMY